MGSMSGTIGGTSSIQGNMNNKNISVKGNIDALFKRGLSAYDLAVASGFEGTATEWLESLRGDKIELMMAEDEIVYWKYTEEDDWMPLIDIGVIADKKVKEAVANASSTLLLNDLPENPMQNILYVVRG